MNKTLFPKVGKCKNCKEDDQELVEVEIDGIKKEVCDACRDGFLITKIENEAK